MFGNQSSAISHCTEIELRTQPGAAEMAVRLAASACPGPAPGLRIRPELLLELGQWRVKVQGRGAHLDPHRDMLSACRHRLTVHTAGIPFPSPIATGDNTQCFCFWGDQP